MSNEEKQFIDLSIVIVSWNVVDLLKKCLTSIFMHQNDLAIEVFVVDNASKDEALEMVKKEFPSVKLIVNEKNHGFARANNQAIKQSRGKYVLLLNPDTEIQENALKNTLDYMEKDETIGITGCRLLYPDKTIQLSVRRFPTLYAMFIIMLKIHNFFPELVDEYYALDFDYYQAGDVDQLMGAFFMIRRQLIEDVGLLDEKFFYWYEEVDYCRRAKKANWRVAYFPGAEVVHYGSESFKQVLTLKRQKVLNASILHYFRKHHSWPAWLVIFCLQPVGCLLSLLISIVYGAKSGRSVK